MAILQGHSALIVNEKSAAERRKHLRVPTPAGVWVSWKIAKHAKTSRVLNLSLSGAFIDSQENIQVGTPLKLLFAMTEGKIQLDAVVRVFQPGKGMGVEFVSMTPSQAQLVRKVVKRLLK